MKNPHCRYFIELQPHDSAPQSRASETAQRRETAKRFLETLHAWFKEKDLGDKVSATSVTMFGQIQITCEAIVIKLIRDQDVLDIAAIRQPGMPAMTGMPMEHAGRWNEAR